MGKGDSFTGLKQLEREADSAVPECLNLKVKVKQGILGSGGTAPRILDLSTRRR
jgi:hypothetical protein